MERIKKALDLAREEREGQQRAIAMATTVDSEPEQITAPNVETGIHYSKTKVIGANHKILQQNRILVTDEELDGRTAFKMLRTQVLQRMVAKGWNALAITSPAPGDGKTIVAANLAISLARELHHHGHARR